MIRTTPFHERTAALNETQLWSHWSGHLAADRYQMSDKFEYFAVRNAAGIFDSSPLYKYRIAGKDAERVPRRDPRPRHPGLPARPRPVHVLARRPRLRHRGRGHPPHGQGRVPPHLGRAELRLLRGPHRPAWRSRSRRSASDIGTLALQGPRSRDLLARLVPQMEHIPYFGVAKGEIGGAAVTVSRTGYSGDLGYEIWIDAARRAPRLGHAVGQRRGPRRPAVRPRRAVHAPHRGRPAAPRRRLRLEPLRLERRPPSTPIELGWAWMFKDLASRRPGVHRPHGARARDRGQDLALGDARPRRRLAGLRSGLQRGRADPAQGPQPRSSRTGCCYDDDYERVGYATSFMYSPMLQRHIAIARVKPEFAKLGHQGEPRVHRRPPLRAGRRARRPAAALQPRAKDGLT